MKIPCSKNKLQNIGKKIRNNENLTFDEEIAFYDFRKSHEKILSNFRGRINNKLGKKENENIIFAQRLKKRDTIINKLRDRHNEMDLSRMHDIAGMRLIFKDIKSLEKFRSTFSKSKLKKYELRNSSDKYDYIKNPRPISGYRGIHDVYREITQNPIKLHIELQYRTKIQHAWSTTLEIWDSYYGQKTKFEQEKAEVCEFFKYISELLARKLESKSFITNIDDYTLFKKIIKMDNKMNIMIKLRDIRKSETNKPITYTENQYILLQKFFDEAKTNLHIELPKGIEEGFELYKKLERLYNSDVVMVNVKSPQKFLPKAYNNYYNDLTDFFRYLDLSLKRLTINNKYKCRLFSFFYNRRYMKYTYN